jgi:hypothetical protein
LLISWLAYSLTVKMEHQYTFQMVDIQPCLKWDANPRSQCLWNPKLHTSLTVCELCSVL